MKLLAIGIDFDNTIINYDSVFFQLALEHKYIPPDSKQLSKQKIRKIILDENDGLDLKWQHLQSLAYGSEIFRASPFEGLKKFVENGIERGHVYYIVSHKSSHSHYDPSVDLRSYAREWMEQQGFFSEGLFKKENVFFCQTLDDKVEKISALKLDMFVDDLEKVFDHTCFPETTVPFLFRSKPVENSLIPIQTWREMEGYLLSLEEDFLSISKFWESINGGIYCPYSVLKREGNNRIIKFQLNSGFEKILKCYHNEECNLEKIAREALAQNFLFKRGFPVARPEQIEESRSLVLSSIPGVSLSNDDYEDFCHDLIGQLKKLKVEFDESHLSYPMWGADSRSCMGDYSKSVLSRMKRIEAGLLIRGAEFTEFRKFYESVIVPKVQNTLSQFDSSPYEAERLFERERLTLSFSDFGPMPLLLFFRDYIPHYGSILIFFRSPSLVEI
jgi:hypothetical protein